MQLYHMQRNALQRKQQEKEDYVARLARDRQNMSEKLAQLQTLLMKLIVKPEAIQKLSESITKSGDVTINGHRDDVTLTPESVEGGADGSFTALLPLNSCTAGECVCVCAGASEGATRSDDTQHANGAASPSQHQVGPQIDPKLLECISAISGDVPVHDFINMFSDIRTNFGFEARVGDTGFPHCGCCSGRVVHV